MSLRSALASFARSASAKDKKTPIKDRAALSRAILETLEERRLLSATPYGGSALTVGLGTSTLEAENYDLGGQGVAYNDSDSSNNGNAYRTSEGVDVYANASQSNGYGVGWTAANEWAGYTIDVATAGTYDVTARVSSGASGGTFHLEFGPVGQIGGTGVVSTSTLTAPATGSFDNFQDVTAHGVQLAAGTQWVRLVEDSGGYNMDYLRFSGLPSGWSSDEVGADAGTTSYNDSTSTWSLNSTSWDIWDDNSEDFQFAHKDLAGDGSVVGRVASVQNTSNWAKAGLMLRNSADQDVPYATVAVTPGDGVYFAWRAAANGSVSTAHVASVTAPQWLKLERSNDDVSAYYSSDGSNWTQIGSSQTVALDNTAQAGLAVAAHNSSTPNTSTFTNVAVTAAASAPATPALATTPGDGQVDLSWAAVTGATSYNLYRSTTSNGEGSTPYQSGLTGTSYTDTGVTNGTTYYYQLTAVNSTGESDPSTEMSAMPAAIPAAPTSLIVTAGDGQVIVSWTAASGATSYNVYRDDGGELSLYAGGIVGTSFTDTSVLNGVSYGYAVSSTGGTGESDPSDLSTPVTPELSAPSLSAESISSTEIDLSWTNPQDGSHLELEMKSPADENFHLIPLPGASPSDPTVHPLTGLHPGTTYSFRLRADKDGLVQYSSDSAETRVNDTGASNPPPAPEVTNIVPHGGFATVYFDGPYGDLMDHGSEYFKIATVSHRTDDPYGVLTDNAQGDGTYDVDEDQYSLDAIMTSSGASYAVQLTANIWNYGETPTYDGPSFSEPFNVSSDGPAVAPVALSSAAASGGQVTLTWDTYETPDAGIFFYAVHNDVLTSWAYYAVASDESLTAPAPESGSQIFAVAEVVGGSGGKHGFSAYSNFVDGHGVQSPPAAPEGLSATVVLQGSQANVRLLWDNIPNNETGYVLQRATQSDFSDATTIASPTVDTTNVVDTDVLLWRTYYYRVKALGAGGTSSAWTTTTAATTFHFSQLLLKRDVEADNLYTTDGGGSIGAEDRYDFKVTFSEPVTNVPGLTWEMWNTSGFNTRVGIGDGSHFRSSVYDEGERFVRFWIDFDSDSQWDSGEPVIDKTFDVVDYTIQTVTVAQPDTIAAISTATVDGYLKQAGDLLSIRNSASDRRAAVRFQRSGIIETWTPTLLAPDIISSSTDFNNLVDSVDARVRIVADYTGDYSNVDGMTLLGQSDSITVRVGVDGRVWAHELGHGLGLNHRASNDPDGNHALMWPSDGGSMDIINDTERAAFED